MKMEYISTKTIIKIVKYYCEKNDIKLSHFVKQCGVSKSWLSRLKTEKNKKISLFFAQKLLNAAGYKLVIEKKDKKAFIVKNTKLKKLGVKYEVEM